MIFRFIKQATQMLCDGTLHVYDRITVHGQINIDCLQKSFEFE